MDGDRDMQAGPEPVQADVRQAAVKAVMPGRGRLEVRIVVEGAEILERHGQGLGLAAVENGALVIFRRDQGAVDASVMISAPSGMVVSANFC